MHQGEVTAELTRFACGAVDIPDAVAAEARRTLLNFVGCVVGGSEHPTVECALQTIGIYFGRGNCSLMGRNERADPLNAALINGIANNVYGYDDTHLDTMIHPGGPVLSSIIALSEELSVSGRRLLDALTVGVDVTCRIGLALGQTHVEAGWHVSGTAGVFGAAAACGRLLELAPEQMSRAFGIAACQPVGLVANFGTMGVSFHIGKAAQHGLLSALLAKKGFTSGSGILDHPQGPLNLLSSHVDTAALTADLGRRFEISRNSYKAYASGVVTHPAMDAAIDLATEHDLDPSSITAIKVKGHPLVLQLTGRQPTTDLESKVSIFHAVAAAVAERRGGIEQFGARALVDPEISRLRSLIKVDVADTIARDEALVTIETRDGRSFEHHVPHSRGSVLRPLSPAELHRKVRNLLEPKLGISAADRLIDLCEGVDELADVSVLPQASRPTR